MDISIIDHQHSLAGQSRIMEKKGALKTDDQALKEACQGFEAIFLNIMLKSMRSTLPGNGLFPESRGMEIYRSMYDENLADKLAAAGSGTGIGSFLYQELSRDQD